MFRPRTFNVLEVLDVLEVPTSFSLVSASTTLLSPILVLGWTLNLPLDLNLFLLVSSEVDDGGLTVDVLRTAEVEVSVLSEELGSLT